MKNSKSFLLTICLTVLITFISSGCGDEKTATELPSGYVEAQEVDISTKIPGRAIKLLVQEGDEVKPGQVVAQLNKKDLKAKENQVLASIRAAKAQLQKAKTGRIVTQSTVKAKLKRARAALEKAKAQAELSTKTFHRMEALFEQGAIPAQQLDQARAKARVVQAAKNEATAAVEEAKAAELKINLAQDEVEAAQAQLEQANAALGEVRNNLQELQVETPCAGTVTAINVEAGELVSTGLPIITVTDFTNNWVEMQVNQDIVQSLQIKQKATVLAGGKSYAGQITRIGSKPSFATRRATTDRGDKDIVTYQVRISVGNPELRPGMNVQVEFEAATGGVNNAA